MGRLRAQDAQLRRASGYGPDFLEALARGLKVIAAFDSSKRQMTLSDVARAADLPRPTTRRVLHTLTCLGFAETDGPMFRLTPRVLKLASAYLGSNMVSSVVQPICDRISRRTGQVCFAAVMDAEDIAVIAHASPLFPLGIGSNIGQRLPAISTAAGRVMLAQLADDALDQWLARVTPKRLTDFTITDKVVVRGRILAAGRQGFASTNQEALLGFRAIAVPLKRFDGICVAAINLAVRIIDAETSVPDEDYLDILCYEAAELMPKLI